MAPMVGDLLRLQAHQVDEAAALVASALLETPAWSYIFEGLNEADRLAAMTLLIALGIRVKVEQGSARCAFAKGGKEEMVCFFMFQPPGVRPCSLPSPPARALCLAVLRACPVGGAAFCRACMVRPDS